MDVLVTGGTGFVGQYLCGELADRGHEVTALARHPDRADLPDDVATARGDVTDYDSLVAAFDGQDAVVNLVALSPLYKPSGGQTHDRVHRGGTENCIRAAEEQGVERFIQMSALGADPDGPTAYIRAKGAAEELVMASELEWTIFRPSVVFGEGGEFVGFTKKLKGIFAPGVPLYPLPGGGQTRFQPIHVEDLVPMIADAIEDDDHAGEIYEIGGPDTLTLAEVARIAFQAEGTSISIVPLPMSLAKVGLTLAGPMPFIPFGPDQARSLEFDNTTVDNDIDAFGVERDDLLTLRAYLGIPE
ncbi:MAG: complex I NDUFA9 subunit family protein [Halobacteriales archaeon]|nr:complex I NDUFA9 subunit family protein [Halobacteriales archaeon]